MSESLKLETPADFYDWAKAHFTDGNFIIGGQHPSQPQWYLMTHGRHCIETLPKKWGVARG